MSSPPFPNNRVKSIFLSISTIDNLAHFKKAFREHIVLLLQFTDNPILLAFLHKGEPEPAVKGRAFRYLRIVKNLFLLGAFSFGPDGHDGEVFGEFGFRFGDVVVAVDFGGDLRTVFECDFRFHISSFPKSS